LNLVNVGKLKRMRRRDYLFEKKMEREREKEERIVG